MRGVVGLARAGEDTARNHCTYERGYGGSPTGSPVQQGLSEQGVYYRLSSPEAFGSFLENEIKRWAKVVKDNKIVVDQ
jgi:hypothetical protein